jgi:hypothetical protein
MYTRPLGKTGERLSALGFGCMGLVGWYGTRNDAEARATLLAAIDSGVTHLDTAASYQNGENERFVGSCIRGRREHNRQTRSGRPAMRALHGWVSKAWISFTCIASIEAYRSRIQSVPWRGWSTLERSATSVSPNAARRPCDAPTPYTQLQPSRVNIRCGHANRRNRSCPRVWSSGRDLLPIAPSAEGFLQETLRGSRTCRRTTIDASSRGSRMRTRTTTPGSCRRSVRSPGARAARLPSLPWRGSWLKTRTSCRFQE